MKKIFYFLWTIAVLTSCEDVVDVDTPTEPPRLSVDAVIRLDTTLTNTTARIRINLSSSFFDNNEPLSVKSVFIQNLDYTPEDPSKSNVLFFFEVAPGIYEGTKETSFFTTGKLSLQIEYNKEKYYAETEFVPTSPINKLEQGNESLFSGDETEVIISFTDDGTRDDFYIFDFDFNEYLVSEDEFYQGQEFEFSYFYGDSIKPGQEIDISILGADESFYNYMNQVIVQSSSGEQGPFQTPAATVRGNIFNITGIEDIDELQSIEQTNSFALGYFAVVQEFKQTITIE